MWKSGRQRFILKCWLFLSLLKVLIKRGFGVFRRWCMYYWALKYLAIWRGIKYEVRMRDTWPNVIYIMCLIRLDLLDLATLCDTKLDHCSCAFAGLSIVPFFVTLMEVLGIAISVSLSIFTLFIHVRSGPLNKIERTVVCVLVSTYHVDLNRVCSWIIHICLVVWVPWRAGLDPIYVDCDSFCRIWLLCNQVDLLFYVILTLLHHW